MVVCEIKGYDKVKVNNIYNKLPILNKSDICISANDIAKILNRRPGAYLKEILKDIEKEILNGNKRAELAIDNFIYQVVGYIG